MPAFVAGLLLGIGDRTSWLAAILADRNQRPFRVIIAAALAFGAGNAAAAQAGLWMPRLTPNAGNLMLALALGFAGIGAIFGAKRPTSFAGWPALPALFILGFGEGMQFVTFALAARAELPAFAAVGATLGTLLAVAPAAVLGEAAWLRLPLKPLRIAVGVVLMLTAAVFAAGALRLG
ncbi:MAG: TMEM165/GDT1 family protein [Pseudomonadota bacterium]